MQIIKRSGQKQTYDPGKITAAIQKVFVSTGQPAPPSVLNDLLSRIEALMGPGADRPVEQIQDKVEQALMESGFYPQAKSYILYRQKRTALRDLRASLATAAGDPQLLPCLEKIQRDFPEQAYSLQALQIKFTSFLKADMPADERLTALIKAAVELTTKEAPSGR